MPRTPPRGRGRTSGTSIGLSLRAAKGSMRPAGRASLPSNEEIFGTPGAAGGVFDRVLLGAENETVAAASDDQDPGLLVRAPSRTSNPERPRTRSMYYNPDDQVVTIRFRDNDRSTGTPVFYAYYDVPRSVWNNLSRVQSPGRFINRTLNGYRYTQVPGVQ